MRFVLLGLTVVALFLPEVCDAQSGDSAMRIREVAVSMTADGHFRLGPDPRSSWELMRFLSQESEAGRYIGATKVQMNSIRELFADAAKKEAQIFRDLKNAGKGNEITATILKYRSELADTSIDEILLPNQMEKLRLLAMRVEVIRMGLPDSLVRGRLAELVGVHENQKTSLLMKAKQIEEDTQAKIVELLRKSEKETLAMLSTEQRSKAELLLGETNDFVEIPRSRSLYHELLEKSKEKKFSRAPSNVAK